MTSRVTRPSLKSMMHEAYSISAKFPYFRKISKFPLFSFKLCSFGFINFLLSPILTMRHLCIMLYTYWTPLLITRRPTAYRPPLGGPKIALDGMGSARVVLKSWLRACLHNISLHVCRQRSLVSLPKAPQRSLTVCEF